MNIQSKMQLERLFNDQDVIYTGDKYNLLRVELSEFFVINPMKDLSNRTNENVSEAKNFLMEFDTGTYDQQYETISKLESAGIPVTTATFSGSKSIHLVLSMAESLTFEYKQAWIAIAAEITNLTSLAPDPACKNEARLSRLAGVIRADTGKMQELLHTGGYLKNSKVSELINKYGIKGASNKANCVAPDPSLDLIRFKWALKAQINAGLSSKLRSAPQWAAAANMYDPLFKLTNWVIDSTGAPRETFLAYAEENIFPYLLNAGYPAFKLDIPINNAYDWKT